MAATPFLALILAGGRGERLWPLSRRHRPKPFLRFPRAGRSLLQATADRLLPLTGGWEGILVVTPAEYAGSVREHLPELPAGNLVLEPEGRDTAPAVALGALAVAARFGPDAVFGTFPADHWIGGPDAFARAVRAAAALAREEDVLVAFGIVSTHAATGYGYIERGEALGAWEGHEAYRVARFTEKPDAATAARYLATGRHLWNAGIFVWRAGVLLEELRRHAPEIMGPLEAAFPDAVDRAYRELPRISVDHALWERTGRAAVLPVTFGWDDLGDWTALERLLRGERPNAVVGRHVGIDTRGVILYTTGDDLIVTIGLEDVVIVRDGELTLIARKDRVGELKEVLARLRQDPSLRRYV